MRQFVDERFLEEPMLRVEHRPPRAGRNWMRGVAALGLVVDRVRHEHRFAIAAAGVDRPDADRLSVAVDPAGKPRHARGAIEVVLNVVLAAPHDLHRSGRHDLRDPRGQIDIVEKEGQPAAEPAAELQVGHMHLFGAQAERLRRRCARVERILHAGPDVGAIAVDAHRAHHRLHGRVSQERHAVVGLDRLRRAGGQFGRDAQRGVECREDRCRRHAAVAGIVELGVDRGERLACAPVGVGDDGDSVFQPHDAFHAGHRLRGTAVDGHELAAGDRRHLDGRAQHAWRAEVDPVHRRCRRPWCGCRGAGAPCAGWNRLPDSSASDWTGLSASQRPGPVRRRWHSSRMPRARRAS